MVFLKGFLKIVWVIISIAISAGVVIFAAGGVGTFVEEFYQDPIGMTAASLALGGVFFAFIFCPIYDEIDNLE